MSDWVLKKLCKGSFFRKNWGWALWLEQCALSGTNLNSAFGQKGFYRRQKETVSEEIFSDLITTVLFRSCCKDYSFCPRGCSSSSLCWIYLVCMVVYISDGVWHFAQSVLIREKTCLLTVLSVIFRCSTEVLLLWSMWWECDWATMYDKQAHCVSMTWMFCCVTEKNRCWPSLFFWRLLLWCCLCGHGHRGVNEAVRSSPMTLVESVECNQKVNLQGSAIVFMWREICAEPSRVSEEEMMIQSCSCDSLLLSWTQVAVMKHRQRINKSEVKRDETVTSMNCNMWNVFVL